MRLGQILDRYSIDTSNRPWLQYFYTFLAFLLVLSMSGIVYGWSSLLLVLEDEGVYSELCTSNSTASVASTAADSLPLWSKMVRSTLRRDSLAIQTNATSTTTCAARSLRFDLVFLMGVLAVFIFSPFHGWTMDTLGARILTMIAACAMLCGLIMFSFGYHTQKLDLLAPSLMFIAAGGMGILMAMFSMARIMPKYISIILALLNVGFDSSPIVFYIYVKIYQAHPSVSPRIFFLAYCAIPILALLLSVFWPKGVGEPKPSSTKPSDDESASKRHNEDADALAISVEMDSINDTEANGPTTANGNASSQKKDIEDISEVEAETNAEHTETSELGPTNLFRLSFKEQFKTKESLFFCLFHITFSFWLSSYMGSVQPRLKAIQPLTTEVDAKIETFTETFGLVLSLAFLSAPFIGYAIYRLKLLKAIFVCVALAIAWSLAQFLPTINLQVVTFILFAVLRAWYYSVIFNTITHIFGWDNAGTLWGVYNVFAGVITLGFYGVSWAVINLWHGSYTIPNLAAVATLIASLLFPMFLAQKKKAYEASLHEQPAE